MAALDWWRRLKASLAIGTVLTTIQSTRRSFLSQGFKKLLSRFSNIMVSPRPDYHACHQQKIIWLDNFYWQTLKSHDEFRFLSSWKHFLSISIRDILPKPAEINPLMNTPTLCIHFLLHEGHFEKNIWLQTLGCVCKIIKPCKDFLSICSEQCFFYLEITSMSFFFSRDLLKTEMALHFRKCCELVCVSSIL